MRLLNSKTLEFREFFDSDIPKYAILSHRWGSDEASFQDFERGLERTRKGFSKIEQCCKMALNHSIEWAWVDTCCIDKKSSAELTEAINSMYNWYRNAEICYVYLVDVLWEDDTPELHRASIERFCKSDWFTRGWTLQELLAPRFVSFHDENWRFIGTKSDLLDKISGITGIEPEYLQHISRSGVPKPCTKSPDCLAHMDEWSFGFSGHIKASVATKMSWASKRETSRIEDTAYCLLGLFNVNMPLLHGEGRKAFIRLQHEIIKQSNDDSIFAWTADLKVSYSGMLARWPTDFTNSKDVQQYGPVRTKRAPFTITNQGIELPITWRAWNNTSGIPPVLIVMLDCGICGPQGFQNIALQLVNRSGLGWARVAAHTLDFQLDTCWYNPLDSTKTMAESVTAAVYSELEKSFSRTPEERVHGLRAVTVASDWNDVRRHWVELYACAQSNKHLGKFFGSNIFRLSSTKIVSRCH